MKKIIFIFTISFFALFANAQDLSSRFDNAKEFYENGEYARSVQELQQLLELVMQLAGSDGNAISENEYIELRTWDAVIARRDEYLGRKVSIESYFAGIREGIFGNPPTANLPSISYFCTFSDEVLDKLLELEQNFLRSYRFFGTVIIGSDRSLALHIEDVR